jgi:hypothetical protein
MNDKQGGLGLALPNLMIFLLVGLGIRPRGHCTLKNEGRTEADEQDFLPGRERASSSAEQLAQHLVEGSMLKL